MFTCLYQISHMKQVNNLILKVVHFFLLRIQINILLRSNTKLSIRLLLSTCLLANTHILFSVIIYKYNKVLINSIFQYLLSQ